MARDARSNDAGSEGIPTANSSRGTFGGQWLAVSCSLSGRSLMSRPSPSTAAVRLDPWGPDDLPLRRSPVGADPAISARLSIRGQCAIHCDLPEGRLHAD